MPSWMKDESIWNKAKNAVDRSRYKTEDAYWAVVTSVYKKMGGRIESYKAKLNKMEKWRNK